MDKNTFIKQAERLDDLHRNGLMLIQDPRDFCFGIDAVLLSAFADIKKNDTVMDFCTGNGVIPILLSAKSEAKSIIGIEIQKKAVDLAKRSVSLNGLCDKIQIYEGDICRISESLSPSSFNVITVNPPYMKKNSGLINPEDGKSIARHELLLTLSDIIKNANYLLVPGGRLYMVHRPHRLPDIFRVLNEFDLEPKTLRLVAPFIDKKPNLVLIEAIKGAGAWLNVMPSLIIYEKPGVYTKEIYDIYYN